MASSKAYLEFILEQVSSLEQISYRAMMGEFLLYYRGKIVGMICDNRLFVKPVQAAVDRLPTAPYAPPYAGARELLVVEEVDNREFLSGLFAAMYEELPEPKPKKKRSAPELSGR